MQLTTHGRIKDEPESSLAQFICGRDPYFTLSEVAPTQQNFVMARIRYSWETFSVGKPFLRPYNQYEEPIYEDTTDQNYIDMSQYQGSFQLTTNVEYEQTTYSPSISQVISAPANLGHYRGRR